MTNRNADNIYKAINKLAEKENNYEFIHHCKDIFNDYMNQKNVINVMIWVLEIPVLGMAFVFLFIVSKQILELEKSEIAMLRSRGFSKVHVNKKYNKKSFWGKIFFGYFTACDIHILPIYLLSIN